MEEKTMMARLERENEKKDMEEKRKRIEGLLKKSEENEKDLAAELKPSRSSSSSGRK